MGRFVYLEPTHLVKSVVANSTGHRTELMMDIQRRGERRGGEGGGGREERENDKEER
jgi:hypothetical protein